MQEDSKFQHTEASTSFTSKSGAINPSILGKISSSTRSGLENNERVLRKSLVGEASVLELMTTVTEAKNNMEVAVKIRDKVIEAYNNIFNIAM